LISAAAVAHSAYFYSMVRSPVRTMPAENLTPIPRMVMVKAHSQERITVKRVRGESGKEAEARMLWAVRFLIGIAEGREQ
jgi:hypothetical protein